MPKKAAELGALQVRRMTRPGLHAVGGVAGLSLQVSSTGARSWILRVMVGSKRRDIGLGGFPDVTLQEARERARIERGKIRNGVDPVAERKARRYELAERQAKQVSFAEACRRFMKKKESELGNAKHKSDWKSTLNYACEGDAKTGTKGIGSIPVADITILHVERVLQPIWHTKTETASRLRARIEKVLSWANVGGLRSGENPARWKDNLDNRLPAPRKISKVAHMPALQIDEIPEFIRTLKASGGIASKALEFLTLTAARTGEVRGATWEEIDFKTWTWTVPAERMKALRLHRVPLSKQAVDLLQKMPRFAESNLVFPGPKGHLISNMAMIAVMRRMKLVAVPHGMRSSFRDWCAERTAFPREVAEAALAHVNGDKVEASYLRTDLFEKRANLMQAWADFCCA